MLFSRQHLLVALQGLARNRVQSLLAMIGMMVGVAALVTSLALGRGAQDALEDQLRAAGANLLMVTAGNYQIKGAIDPGTGEATSHGFGWLDDSVPQLEPYLDLDGARDPWAGQGGLQQADFGPGAASAELIPATFFVDPDANLFQRVHFEDDPMAIHDHPTAAQRLGDSAAGLGSAATLTRDDARAIAKIPGVKFVVSGVHENERIYVKGSEAQWFTRMHGTEADLPEIRSGWTMLHGRFLSHEEVDRTAQVAVLGKVVADHLFGADSNPVGQTIMLWHQPFKVIGVVGSRSWVAQPTPGDDQFDAFYVPISTIHKLLNLSKLNNVAVTTQDVSQTTQVRKDIIKLLRKRHKIGEAMADDFQVESVAQQVLGKGLAPSVARIVSGNMARVDDMTVANLSASLKRTNHTIVALLAGVAMVSLLVGGIGVMNLLLLSVTQRTREVGLRMALGARARDIAGQFLLEAILLSFIGALAGVALGVVASGTLEGFFHWSVAISPVAAVLAVFVAIALGVIFGVYPARRAAQLNPIEALHYE